MYNRRDFLMMTGALSATALMARMNSHAAEPAGPDVYEAIDDGMVEGAVADRTKVVEEAVITAVNSIVRTMTRETGLGAAWQKLFPNIGPDSNIAVKVNLLRNFNGPQFATLKAMVLGLKSMFGGAYKGDIFVFDNDWNGRLLKVDSHYADYDLDGLGIRHEEDTYQGEQIQIAGNTMNVSTMLSRSQFGINMAASRRHHLYAGHFSGMIKNMIGAVSKNTGTYKCLSARDHGEFHDGTNFQGYIDLFSRYMKNKLHLYVADHVLIPLDESKAFYDKIGRTILIGTDPCAVDSRSVDILKTHYPKATITKAVPEALAEAGVGTSGYRLHKVPTSNALSESNVPGGNGWITLSLASVPYKLSQVSFPVSRRIRSGNFQIYTLRGRHLNNIPFRASGANGSLTFWNGRDKHGNLLKPGVFMVKFTGKGYSNSRRLVLAG